MKFKQRDFKEFSRKSAFIKNRSGLILTLLATTLLTQNCVGMYAQLTVPSERNKQPGVIIFGARIGESNAELMHQGKIALMQKSGGEWIPFKQDIFTGNANEDRTAVQVFSVYNYFTVISGLPEGEYALVYSNLTRKTEDLKFENERKVRTITVYEHNLFFDKDQSYQVMPIKVRSGQVNFLGMYDVIIPPGQSGNKLNATLKKSTTTDFGYYVNAYLFGYTGPHTETNMESRALYALKLNNGKNSYWVPILEKRMAELEGK